MTSHIAAREQHLPEGFEEGDFTHTWSEGTALPRSNSVHEDEHLSVALGQTRLPAPSYRGFNT